MAEKSINFTRERLIKLVNDRNKGRDLYHDATQKGLVICVSPSGNKSFQLHHWDKLRRRSVVMTLGKFPVVTVNQARDKARTLIAQIEDGIDVKARAKAAKEEDTFSDVFDDWLNKHAKPHKKSWEEDQRRYKLYMKKPIGNKPLSWFNPDRVRKWHSGITKLPKQRGGKVATSSNARRKKEMITVSTSTANRALALLSTVFNQMRPHATNPCKGVKKFPEKSRSRFLQPAELKRFLQALDAPETPDIIRDYLYLSLFTGGRRSNVLSMQWGELDLDSRIWRIPPAKSKNGEEMLVPLTDEATEILERRKKSASSMFVFPGKGKSGHLVEPRRPWKDLLERSEITDLRLHDLRRTLGSYQTISGASTTIVGRTLGHKSPEATAVYTRLNIDPVRASVEKATATMLAMKDAPDKVVKIADKVKGEKL